MNEKQDGDGFIKKIGHRIERSVPASYKSPDETETHEKIVEFVEDKGEPETKEETKTYLEKILLSNWDVLDKAKRRINEIQTEIESARIAVQVLEAINTKSFSVDMKWLINRIGVLKEFEKTKGTNTGLNILENEAIGIIEEILREDKKIR